MAVSVGDLDPRQVERLRVALAEAIAAHFAYPPFFVYRAGRSVYRPIDRAKQEQIADFLRSVNFAALDPVDVASPEVRRFIERLFTRYLQVNVDITQPRQARRQPELRARAPKIAADLQKGLLAHLNGQNADFGTRQMQRSWASNARPSRLPEDELERRNHILETTLVRLRNGELATFSRSIPAVHDPRANPAVRHPQTSSAAQPPRSPFSRSWAYEQADPTVHAPAQGFADAFSASASSGQYREAQLPAVTELPTSQMPAIGRGDERNGSGLYGSNSSTAHIEPDLVQLYGDYLQDMQPDLPAHNDVPVARAAAASYPAPPVSFPPAGNGWAASSPSSADSAAIYSSDGRRDEAVFSQLRFQLEGFVRTAARGYGIEADGKDPSLVLDFLRSSGFVDEADLRIAESILALADRVTGNGMASLEDYRQALMLYLLYHRSHLGI